MVNGSVATSIRWLPLMGQTWKMIMFSILVPSMIMPVLIILVHLEYPIFYLLATTMVIHPTPAHRLFKEKVRLATGPPHHIVVVKL